LARTAGGGPGGPGAGRPVITLAPPPLIPAAEGIDHAVQPEGEGDEPQYEYGKGFLKAAADERIDAGDQVDGREQDERQGESKRD